MLTIPRKRELTRYMGEVMEECLSNIPVTRRQPDYEKIGQEPKTWLLRTGYEATMRLACKARREGANSRAQALEWAFDALIRGNGMKRVSEVYLTHYPERDADGFVHAFPYFEARVRERVEDE